jgi:hypothetical protein
MFFEDDIFTKELKIEFLIKNERVTVKVESLAFVINQANYKKAYLKASDFYWVFEQHEREECKLVDTNNENKDVKLVQDNG